jgi:lipocalin
MVCHVAATLEVPGFGSCPRVNIIQNLDVSRFFGRWYEICAYPNKLTVGASCVYSTYAWGQNNGIQVYTRAVSLGKQNTYMGSATVVANGVLGVTYPAYRKVKNLINAKIAHSVIPQPRPTRTTTFWTPTTRTTLWSSAATTTTGLNL